MAESVKVQRLSDFAARQQPVSAATVGRRVSGLQLDIIVRDFAVDLAADGYTDNGVRRRVSVVEHFGRWLEQVGIALRRLTAEHADRFLRYHLAHCHCPEPAPKDRAHCRSAIARFVRYLRARQLVRSIVPKLPPRKPVDRLLAAYDRHLKEVRGLSPGTRQNRHRDARRFLQWRFGDRPLRLRQLQPKEVSGYVLARARHLRATALHPLCGNLRSFLGFLEFSRRLRRGLVGWVPPLPHRAVPALPQVLQPPERRAFLNSFARSTPRGRRDYAIALCLSDLALRGQEVASLTLDDLDWRAMTVRLAQTKQRRERLIPLPDRVARAILDYLKWGRPPAQNRALFVHRQVPCGRPLAAHYVRKIVRRAFAHCGIQARGTHVLRHTWATWAHRRGASLKLIADVLGHRSLEATTGYAHVNVEELRRVALPWPTNRR